MTCGGRSIRCRNDPPRWLDAALGALEPPDADPARQGHPGRPAPQLGPLGDGDRPGGVALGPSGGRFGASPFFLALGAGGVRCE